MADEPFFSLVVPTYNRGHLIKKTLNSLLIQTWSSYEIIVVDDGSQDDTEAVVASLNSPRIHYFKKENAERAAARNYGVQRARGDYINFFDSDDIALPNHLANAAQMVQKNDSPEWLHLGYAVVTPENETIRQVNAYHGDTLQPYFANGNPLSCNGVFLRKDVINATKFNEDRDLSGSEDYELWYRLAALYPLYYSNEITSWVVDHESRSVRTMDANRLIKRLDLLLFYLRQDHQVQKVFRANFNVTEASIYLYLALHVSDIRASKIKGMCFLTKAFCRNLNVIFQRTFYATIRNIFLKW